MQCLFFIWRPGHHRSSEELQGLGKCVMGDSKFKNSNVHGSHSNINLIWAKLDWAWLCGLGWALALI